MLLQQILKPSFIPGPLPSRFHPRLNVRGISNPTVIFRVLCSNIICDSGIDLFDSLARKTSFPYDVGRLGGDVIKLVAARIVGVRGFDSAGGAEAPVE